MGERSSATAVPGRRGRLFRCAHRQRPKNLLCGLASIALASTLAIRARPTKERRIRQRKSAGRWATAVSSTALAGWRAMRGGNDWALDSPCTANATSSNTPSTARTWKCTTFFGSRRRAARNLTLLSLKSDWVVEFSANFSRWKVVIAARLDSGNRTTRARA